MLLSVQCLVIQVASSLINHGNINVVVVVVFKLGWMSVVQDFIYISSGFI